MQKSNIVIPIRGAKDKWPRNEKGDPAFTSIAHLHTQYSDEQIVEMCNRYLRQQEYQDKASADYQERLRQARRGGGEKKP